MKRILVKLAIIVLSVFLFILLLGCSRQEIRNNDQDTYKRDYEMQKDNDIEEEEVEEEDIESGEFDVENENNIRFIVDGNRVAIRKTPGTTDKPSDDVLERVDSGHQLILMTNHNNTITVDGYTWWEVYNPTSNSNGWMASEFLSEFEKGTDGSGPVQDNDGSTYLTDKDLNDLMNSLRMPFGELPGFYQRTETMYMAVGSYSHPDTGKMNQVITLGGDRKTEKLVRAYIRIECAPELPVDLFIFFSASVAAEVLELIYPNWIDMIEFFGTELTGLNQKFKAGQNIDKTYKLNDSKIEINIEDNWLRIISLREGYPR